ncbi:MAG TPA: diacylglycerol kinase family protein [Polyangiaceae bacterium]|nr:diacylglycerol kinase family protein [Polyangiaceae bacterium]
MDGKRGGAEPWVDLVVNGNAGRLKQEPRLALALADAARAEGARVHETRSREELEAAAHAIAERGTQGVLLAGGDGSVGAGLTALSHAYAVAKRAALPPFALVPAGTVCTIARNFGVRGDPVACTRRASRALADGTASLRRSSTLLVADDRGGERVAVIFAAGLAVRFFELYDAAPRPGVGAAASIALRLFAGSLVGSAEARRVIDPTPGELEIDGRLEVAKAWSLVLASTVPDVAPHLRAAYRAGEGRGFHVVASGLPARALGPQLWRVFRGKPLVGEPRVDTLAERISLAFMGEGAYVLDGDRFAARKVRVAVGPAVSIASG